MTTTRTFSDIDHMLANMMLSRSDLFYAYNVATTPAKGRIVFEPTAHLLGRF